ncbi:MAG TPA: hypothetical protein VIF60_07280 [Burkholderiaceae bacterium]
MTDNRGMANNKTVELGGNQALALLIRQAIGESGLLGREIAGLCEVKPQAVSNWKTTGRIEKQNLEKLAAITKKPLAFFSTLRMNQAKTATGAYGPVRGREPQRAAEIAERYRASPKAAKPNLAGKTVKPSSESLELAARIQKLPPHQRRLIAQLIDQLAE